MDAALSALFPDTYMTFGNRKKRDEILAILVKTSPEVAMRILMVGLNATVDRLLAGEPQR